MLLKSLEHKNIVKYYSFEIAEDYSGIINFLILKFSFFFHII